MLTIGTAVTLTIVETGRGQTTSRSKQAETQPGYGAAFQIALANIGQITPAELAARRPEPPYNPKFGWDPTTAKYWDQVMQATPTAPDPATLPSDPFERAKLLRPKHREPWYDFRVNADELAKFQENGFVVSERMGASSFGELFYRVYSRDLPVFISADAILQAWHRSYDAMLEELELTYLSASLSNLLAGMSSAVPAAKADYGNGPLASGLLDSDYFLAVARSLLSGQQTPSKLDQDDRVAETLRAVEAEQMQTFTLFGRNRNMDFSQFKPRGHYEMSDSLREYFRAMMWCGRIDLRIAGGLDANGPLSSPRELGSALVLNDLLNRSGKFDQWRQFDALLQTFVGRADSATFAHLDALLKEAKLSDISAIKEEKVLEKLQVDILAGRFGLQDIRGDVYVNPGGSQPIQMPRSFTVLGQRFAVDSWALSKVVYDDISWDGDLVQRRIPSDLDLAFSVLGNDHVVPDLVLSIG
jgi:hypothetical protein